jgi:hypothetical protein
MLANDDSGPRVDLDDLHLPLAVIAVGEAGILGTAGLQKTVLVVGDEVVGLTAPGARDRVDGSHDRLLVTFHLKILRVLNEHATDVGSE